MSLLNKAVLPNVDSDWEKRDWFELEEEIFSYHVGGNHPAVIGDELNNRYEIVHKLGNGGFSMVWLAWDRKSERLVALKILKADQDPEREYLVSQYLATKLGTIAINAPLDWYTITGPNGEHGCIVMDIAGESLRDVLEDTSDDGGPLPLDMARATIGSLLDIVSGLHGTGIVHGDLHPGNILFHNTECLDNVDATSLYHRYGCPLIRPIDTFTSEQIDGTLPPYIVMPILMQPDGHVMRPISTKIKLSDFGEAFDPDAETRYRSYTPLLSMPPEAHFISYDTALSYPADIWALATVIFETLSTVRPFAVGSNRMDDAIEQHIERLGPLPEDWWNQWEAKSQWLERSKQTRCPLRSLEAVFECGISESRVNKGMPGMSDEELSALYGILRRMFAFRPEERASIEQILESEWVSNWVLPSMNAISKSGYSGTSSRLPTPDSDLRPVSTKSSLITIPEIENRESGRIETGTEHDSSLLKTQNIPTDAVPDVNHDDACANEEGTESGIVLQSVLPVDDLINCSTDIAVSNDNITTKLKTKSRALDKVRFCSLPSVSKIREALRSRVTTNSRERSAAFIIIENPVLDHDPQERLSNLPVGPIQKDHDLQVVRDILPADGSQNFLALPYTDVPEQDLPSFEGDESESSLESPLPVDKLGKVKQVWDRLRSKALEKITTCLDADVQYPEVKSPRTHARPQVALPEILPSIPTPEIVPYYVYDDGSEDQQKSEAAQKCFDKQLEDFKMILEENFQKEILAQKTYYEQRLLALEQKSGENSTRSDCRFWEHQAQIRSLKEEVDRLKKENKEQKAKLTRGAKFFPSLSTKGAYNTSQQLPEDAPVLHSKIPLLERLDNGKRKAYKSIRNRGSRICSNVKNAFREVERIGSSLVVVQAY